MSVQLAILGFLHERDYHGYELKKTIERLMGMWTDIKFGSIYHALSQLEKAGHVEKVATVRDSAKPERSIFSVTPAGSEEFLRLLRENILELKPIYLKDDIGVFFGGRIGKAEFDTILEKRLELMRSIYEIILQHSADFESYAADRIAIARQLIRRHILHMEAEIDWFEGLREELRRGGLYAVEESEVGTKL